MTPGKYVLVCNLAEHYGLGMRAAVHGHGTVSSEEAAGPAGRTSGISPSGRRRRRRRTDIGWPRAIASGLAVLVVGFVGAVVGANRS